MTEPKLLALPREVRRVAMVSADDLGYLGSQPVNKLSRKPLLRATTTGSSTRTWCA